MKRPAEVLVELEGLMAVHDLVADQMSTIIGHRALACDDLLFVASQPAEKRLSCARATCSSSNAGFGFDDPVDFGGPTAVVSPRQWLLGARWSF